MVVGARASASAAVRRDEVVITMLSCSFDVFVATFVATEVWVLF